MSKEALTGIVVGFVIGLTTYVIKNKEFTKIQKIILSLLMVFFPAQIAGIILVKLYNKFQTKKKYKNSPQYLIDTLNDLKDKGVISIDLYNEKLENIHRENNIKQQLNSEENKKLKILFEKGILTEEEYLHKTFESVIYNDDIVYGTPPSTNDEKKINKITKIENYNSIENLNTTKSNFFKLSTTKIVVSIIVVFIIGIIIISENSTNSVNTLYEESYDENNVVTATLPIEDELDESENNNNLNNTISNEIINYDSTDKETIITHYHPDFKLSISKKYKEISIDDNEIIYVDENNSVISITSQFDYYDINHYYNYLKNYHQNNGAVILYERFKSNFFVIKFENDEFIYYQKAIITNSGIKTGTIYFSKPVHLNFEHYITMFFKGFQPD